MKKNILIKFFTFSFIFLFSALSGFAEEINYLKRIVVQPLNNKEYTLNFLFDNQYKGKAFLQKNGPNGYYIYLPDAASASKRININYINSSDKRKIKFYTEIKPLIKNNVQTKYIKINVFMNGYYNLKLLSGLSSDYHPFLTELKKSLVKFSIILFIGIIFLFILTKHIKKMLNTPDINSYTSFPVNLDTEYKKNSDTPVKPIESKIQRVIIPRKDIKKSFSSPNEKKFDCFNIDTFSKPKNSSYEIKSSLNETSNLLNDKSNTVKLKHTNPITKKTKTEESELSIPMVDEVLASDKNVNVKNVPNQPEILSVLNFAPNKGFYLMSDDNTFKLFGFIHKQIFLLETFKDLSQINLQARYYDKSGKNEIYIVKLDSYKAMIEVSDSSMKELAKV